MLILLDIDGVMIPAAGWKPSPLLEDGFPAFHAKAVSALNHILAGEEASIVLTTSHKSNFSVAGWEQIFRTRGINASIQKLDDNINGLDRRAEILNWLEKSCNNEHFVIIDDDKGLNGLPAEIKERLVLTKSLVGLTEEDANAAIAVLNQDSLVTL